LPSGRIKKALSCCAALRRRSLETLVGDPVRLRQISSIFLGNALKFTDHGDVLVAVEVES
jgi:signal transduction histidine kinase